MLREFVRVPRVSNWAIFAVQISKDEALTPLLTLNSRAFVYFCASIMCPSRNFENSQHLSNSTELWTKDIAGIRKQGYKSRNTPIPICISRDASMECLLTGRYWAVRGYMVWKKSRQWRVVWGKVGYSTLRNPVESGDSIQRGWGTWVSGDSSAVRALDSWSKGPGFESPQEQ